MAPAAFITSTQVGEASVVLSCSRCNVTVATKVPVSDKTSPCVADIDALYTSLAARDAVIEVKAIIILHFKC